ncbi:MAG: formate dehydrogenase, partial [Marinobacter sp.]|nr:formate dehydrogenase [Marinobacter sp.]
MINVYVPRDTTALSLGADAVADRLEQEIQHRSLSAQVVRNGSRGLFWLEPLIEVDTSEGRVAYGPVTPDDIPDLLDQGMLDGGGSHPLCQGYTEAIPYLQNQQRLTFARVGITDPLSITDYRNHGGFRGLERALGLEASQIVDEVERSGLRGRGGAAFPAGRKWRTVLEANPEQPGHPWSGHKFIVCNADEGDSGT